MSPRPRPGRGARPRPWSWVQALVLALALGLVAGIVAPRAQAAGDWAVAEQARADFDTLRRAVFDHVSAHGRWPPHAGPGEVPPGLEVFLPEGFRLVADHHELHWDHWRLPDGLPRQPGVRVLAGISLTTDRPRVGEALVRALEPGGAWYRLGDRYTYLLEGP